MYLYEYRTRLGELSEIMTDSHVDEFEFVQMCKKQYSVDIEPGSVKQKWQTSILNKRKFHDQKVAYSYPVTIGKVV